AGVSHMLEHMTFKGTKHRSAYQIARSLEELGGDLNAYTSKEYTCYHGLVLKEHWRESLDVVCDLVTSMKAKKEDYDLEKSVILQEIAMSADSVEEIAYDWYFEKALGKHPLARPILGTEKSVSSMKLREVEDYYETYYRGNNLIIAAAGDVDHWDLVAALEKKMGSVKGRMVSKKREKPKHFKIRDVIEKQAEQTHVLIGIPVGSFKDPSRFEASIVNNLLGGGMTSRLFQSVREKKGLAYSVYSSLNTFVDFGLLMIAAGTQANQAPKLLETIRKEMLKLLKNGISKSDLELFRTQLNGAILLGSDDVENRMTSLGVNEMVYGHYRPVEKVIAEIDAVTLDSTHEFLEEKLRIDQAGLLVVGSGTGRIEKQVKEWGLT
ncbi:MAG: M16 family metallopeptidase, partial [Pseudobdellovibrionaceae bacterium]